MEMEGTGRVLASAVAPCNVRRGVVLSGLIINIGVVATKVGVASTGEGVADREAISGRSASGRATAALVREVSRVAGVVSLAIFCAVLVAARLRTVGYTAVSVSACTVDLAVMGNGSVVGVVSTVPGVASADVL